MLSRYECLKILELAPGANSYEIETRYTMLLKRYRHDTDPETRARLDQITLAYNILTDRYVEPEPVDPKMEKIMLGKSRRQWQNIWHYGRWPFLAGAVALALVVYFIISVVTNTPPDIQLVAVGIFAQADDADSRVDNYVKGTSPDIKKVEFQALPIYFPVTGTSESSTADTSSIDNYDQSSFLMKMLAIIAGDSIEIFVCDQGNFDHYAAQGVFQDIGDLYAKIQDLPPDILAKIKPLRRDVVESTSGDTSETTAPTRSDEEMDQDQALPVIGLDVSALHLTEGLGLYSGSQILTIGIKANKRPLAVIFLEQWIRDYNLMHQLQKEYEDRVKASLPTESTTITGTTSLPSGTTAAP